MAPTAHNGPNSSDGSNGPNSSNDRKGTKKLSVQMKPEKKSRSLLPEVAVTRMTDWFKNNLEHPYPSDAKKEEFVKETNLTVTQVNDWFINARRRQWKKFIAEHQKSDGSSESNPEAVLIDSDHEESPPMDAKYKLFILALVASQFLEELNRENENASKKA
ncbi:homeobox Meis3 isoform X1 [Pelobates cultripes]|uniref:Homeobox Meis3 isoform X1 n=1 Tax=Pelobates cultripes TaxID=61616 RepID=A0AAD1W4E7_PELCU|nr:homeobox Meis3 isoform X1 [Pelobates cultripes]